MYYLKLFILLMGLASFACMLLGLIKPWMLLWWEDVQNRRKVIKLYGTAGTFFLLTYGLLNYFIK